MLPEVRIVDCGLGNLSSVLNAFSVLGCNAALARTPEELARATHIVLPGVGAFADGMRKLRADGWDEALSAAVLVEGRPALGLCLGMQMLMSRGTEHRETAGLGWIRGDVLRLPENEQEAVRVPHVGWNGVKPVEGCGLFQGLGAEPDFYFVHSYAVAPTQRAHCAAVSTHGRPFVAAVHRGHVHGVQFHPEKSHKAGLGLLANFLRTSEETHC